MSRLDDAALHEFDGGGADVHADPLSAEMLKPVRVHADEPVTIVVMPGVFRLPEPVVVSGPVTIRGDGTAR